MRRVLLAIVAWLAFMGPRRSDAPVRYRFTFPDPQHRWMQVEASFEGVGDSPLALRMSRSSPGRYVLHEFAKNVYDLRATGRDGRELTLERSDDSGWSVTNHGGI